jgi:hypothetical protein
VAAHEAGHELVRRVLLGDKYKSDFITVIPGVEMIGRTWIYYAGLAQHEKTHSFMMNREAALRELAVLMAGFLGEQNVRIGTRHSSGKSSDITLATQFAESMVLKWGLEPKWGTMSSDSQNLSDDRRKFKEQLVINILKEAEELARKTIQVNREVHLELTRQLAKRGELKAEDLKKIYEGFTLRDVKDWNSSMKPRMRVADLTHNVELIPEVDIPDVANIDDIIEADRKAQVEKAQIPRPLPILSDFGSQKNVIQVALDKVKATEFESSSSQSCRAFFN